MPGFRISNIVCKRDMYRYRYAKTISFEKYCNGWSIDGCTLNKFMDDKVFHEDEYHIIILEGVSLNSSFLKAKYKCNEWKVLIDELVRRQGIEWFRELEGPVSGAVYYKKEDKWVVFTSRLGEKAVFYYATSGKFIFGSQLKDLTNALSDNGIPLSPNIEALKHLMAYGSYIGTETCVEGIARLYPGHYLTYEQGKVSCHEYCIYDIEQSKDSRTEEEYIELLDKSFKNSINRILVKNLEYGYKSVVDISGGYDSRLNCYTMNSLGAKDVIMDCYAQSDSHDFKVSNQIANELGYDYVFRALDNASCLLGIDDNVLMLNGASAYYGITGGRDMLHMLTGFDVGLEITGLLGDVHDGSMVINYSDGAIDEEYYRDSRTLTKGLDYDFPQEETNRFENHVNEHFWFYNRGMLFGMASFFIRQNFVEPVTAYGDPEFLKVYLSIPWDMRVKGKLLRKWLTKKYPEAANYADSQTGLKLKHDIDSRYYLLGKAYKQIKKYFGILMAGKRPRGMNDTEYWYRNNRDLRKYLDGYIDSYVSLVDSYSDIRKLIDKLLATNKMIDKIFALTVISIFKNYIIEEESDV